MKNFTAAEDQLRAEAVAIIAAHDKADAVRVRINQFDADAAGQLAALDTEIQELDRRADSCDEVAVQQLVVKRELRSRLAAKVSIDRQQRVGELALESRACFDGVPGLGDFFIKAHGQILEHAILTLADFYESRQRAENAAAQTDAVRCAWNLRSFIVIHTPDSALIERLKKFADGTCPVWRV